MLESIYSDQHGWEPFLNLKGQIPTPIIVDKIEVLRYHDTFLVRATSRDGAIGVLTCNARAPYLYPMLKELVIPFFIGKDARHLETLVNEVYIYHSNYKYAGTPFWNCVAYVEGALFDLMGQVTGKSVGEFLGGRWRDRIPTYLSRSNRETTAQQEVDAVTQRLAETHARAVKMKIGGRMRNNEDSLPGRTEELIPLARQAWGPDITLYLDGNGSYDHVKAIEVGHLMEEYGYAFLEEPCPFEQWEETKAVADSLELPVAGGEQDCNLGQFRFMIRERVVDVAQLDLMYNGGIIRALRVAKMAQMAGLPVTPHSPKYSPELATLLHFASVVRNTGPFMEFPARHVTHEDWYAPQFSIQEGGFIDVPTGAGLGITYDDKLWKSADLI